MLEESDRNVRYYSTKLLTYLLANRGAEIESAVLQSASNITRLMDLLKLGNEMIRNEALLLLIEISKTNVELQKVIAFENGFENLLDIIESEGLANGGIVAQDCLTLINNLLAGNTSNQNHFREMNCIKRLSALLKLEASDFWSISDDKRDNIVLTFNAVCTLLSSPSSIEISQNLILASSRTPDSSSNKPSSQQNNHPSQNQPSSNATNGSTSGFSSTEILIPSSSIQSTQTQLGMHQVLSRTIEIGLSQIRAPTIRIKALWALGDQIFCHSANRSQLEQYAFETRSGTSSGRTSAMLKVTQTVFFSKVPMESLAALSVLRSYFHYNPAGQRVFASTIIAPTNPSANSLSHLVDEAYPARIIIGHLSPLSDAMKTFFACLSLSYILMGNNGVKEQLLKVPFGAAGADQNQKFENLLSKLTLWLVSAIDKNVELPIIVGLFRVISSWVDGCQLAENFFRSIQVVSALTGPESVPITTYLAALIPHNASGSVNTNLNFAAGLAAHVYGLVLDPTTPSGPGFLERQPIFQARLDSIRLSPDFVNVERGALRKIDDESKLPFFDAPFVLSHLRLYYTLFPSQAANNPSTHTEKAPSAGNQNQTQNNFAPSAHQTHPSGANQPHNHSHPSRVASPPQASQSSPSLESQNSNQMNANQNSASMGSNGTHTSSSPSSNSSHGHANQNKDAHAQNNLAGEEKSKIYVQEIESLRSALAALQQEKALWLKEQSALRTQLDQVQSYSAQLQFQLQTSTATNQTLVTQLTQLQTTTPSPHPSFSNSNDNQEMRQELEKLKQEHSELQSMHDDLLILLAETQDENDAVKTELEQLKNAGGPKQNNGNGITSYMPPTSAIESDSYLL